MNSSSLNRTSSTAPKSWIDWTNLVLGVFLATSPWLALGGNAVIAWNAVTCGVLVACIAGAALVKPTSGAETSNAFVGLRLLVAPWALGFSSYAGATWTSVLVGLTVACLAAAQLSRVKRSVRA